MIKLSSNRILGRECYNLDQVYTKIEPQEKTAWNKNLVEIVTNWNKKLRISKK